MAAAALTGVATPALAGPAPSCVWVDVHSFNTVTVWNQCTYNLRLKVDWGSLAPYSSCYAITAGQFKYVTGYSKPFAQYKKVVTC